MDRIEPVRKIIDELILTIQDDDERRCAYIHLYGVSQLCALLAYKRNCDAELSVIAGLLHDIYSYTNMDPSDHAHKGAEMARSILTPLKSFNDEEVSLICSAIYNHSDKCNIHDAFDEVLKDADVMQHCLYNPAQKKKEAEEQRFDVLKTELGLNY